MPRVRHLPAVVPADRWIRREGDYWTIICGARALHFKDSKGFRYLARLLAEPHVEVHVLELVGTLADREFARGAPAPPGREIVLDHRAKAEYRERLRELDREIEDAHRCADIGRSARAEAERTALAHQLASALGLSGRDRSLPSHSERARVNVTRTIRAAIDRIAKCSPELGGHLRASVRTGTFCSYSPHPGVSDRWYVG